MLYFKNLYIYIYIVVVVLWCFSRFPFLLFTRNFRRFTYLRKLTVHDLSVKHDCSATRQMPGVNKNRKKKSLYQIYCLGHTRGSCFAPAVPHLWYTGPQDFSKIPIARMCVETRGGKRKKQTKTPQMQPQAPPKQHKNKLTI